MLYKYGAMCWQLLNNNNNLLVDLLFDSCVIMIDR